jgi:hypothetical protein
MMWIKTDESNIDDIISQIRSYGKIVSVLEDSSFYFQPKYKFETDDVYDICDDAGVEIEDV